MGGQSSETNRNRKIIIGFGTGRCGTKSLAEFLNQQPGFDITHEGVKLGWYPATTDTEIGIKEFVNRRDKVIGDIGFYWIHYLDLILRQYRNAKAINIVRPDEEVVNSFWSYMKPDETVYSFGNWRGYPYDSMDRTKDAIRQTITRYRFLEYQVQRLYPASIYQMTMQELNDKSVLDDLLDWIGEDGPHVVQSIHTNTREQMLIRNGCLINRLRRRFGGVKNGSTAKIS